MNRKPRRAAAIALMLLAAGLWVAAFVTVFLAPDVYEAVTLIYLEKDGPDREEFGESSRDERWVVAQLERVQAKSVLHAVITNLNLQRQWAEKFKEPEPIPLPRAYALLRHRLKVVQRRDNNLVEIRVRSESPVEAASIANTIAVTYREQRLNRWRDMSNGSFQQMSNEVEVLNGRIQKAGEIRADLHQELRSKGVVVPVNEPAGLEPTDERVPFFKASREVDKLLHGRERILTRMWQEKVEMSMGSSALEIIEKAEVPLRPLPPDYRRASIFFGVGIVSAILGVLTYRRSLDGAPAFNTPPANERGSGGFFYDR